MESLRALRLMTPFENPFHLVHPVRFSGFMEKRELNHGFHGYHGWARRVSHGGNAWKRLGIATASRFRNRRDSRFRNLRYDKCSPAHGPCSKAADSAHSIQPGSGKRLPSPIARPVTPHHGPSPPLAAIGWVFHGAASKNRF